MEFNEVVQIANKICDLYYIDCDRGICNCPFFNFDIGCMVLALIADNTDKKRYKIPDIEEICKSYKIRKENKNEV